MSDDYLWDKSGAPDEDELWLERVMPTLSREGSRPLSTVPTLVSRRHGPGWRSPELAAAAVLALLIGLGAALFFLTGEPRSDSARREEQASAKSHAGSSISAAPQRGLARSVPSQPSPPARDPLFHPAPVASAPVPRKLDPSSIQEVVARHQSEIRRVCWTAALESRKPDAPNTARVQATLVISPSGVVRSAMTQSAEVDSYPDLPPCMARQMRRWKFGRSVEGATVQIPFVFVVQR